MSVVVVESPPALLTLDDAKSHLRVDGTDDDAYITSLLAAAQGGIDGPPGWLGISIGAQTLELRAQTFEDVDGDGAPLPYGPVTGIVSIACIAPDGTLVTVDPTLYGLEGDSLTLAPHRCWPVTAFRSDAVRIRYAAGFPPPAGQPAAAAVPAAIMHALKIMVGLLFENRLGAADLDENPTVASLLRPYRRWGR